jgi:hypothetical protein
MLTRLKVLVEQFMAANGDSNKAIRSPRPSQEPGLLLKLSGT